MDQIMRLRRRAVHDVGINDQNNGARHEEAFTKIIRKKGLLDERKLLQDSHGPLRPQGGIALLKALPTGLRGFARGKISPKTALLHEKLPGVENVQRLYEHAEQHRLELNLYIVGEGSDTDEKEPAMGEQPEATTTPSGNGEVRP
jgi:succinate dehydrogenase / fumarate reductase iron-sulfur subunit